MNKQKGFFWGLLSGALWGLDGVLLGLSMNSPLFAEEKLQVFFSTNLKILLIVPFLVGAMHDGISSLFLFINNVRLKQQRQMFKDLKTSSGLVIILAAILGGPIAMIGQLMSINLVSASYTLPITAAYPALGAILGMVFLKEKLTSGIGLGIILSILGTFVIGLNSGDIVLASKTPDFFSSIKFVNLEQLGVMFAFIPLLGWALEGVISTYAMKNISPNIAINIRQTVSFFFYVFVAIPLLIGREGVLPLGNQIIGDTQNFIPLITVTSLVGALSFLFWYMAMDKIGVGRGMALNITYALWGIIFNSLLTGQKITEVLVWGALLITLGSLFVVINPSFAKLQKMVQLPFKGRV